MKNTGYLLANSLCLYKCLGHCVIEFLNQQVWMLIEFLQVLCISYDLVVLDVIVVVAFIPTASCLQGTNGSTTIYLRLFCAQMEHRQDV